MLDIFRTWVEQPIFNLLEVIYAFIPGHDLGVSIIVFTIIIRLALWPLVKKQLHHTKKMRVIAPELKKIKKAAGGDRQKEARLQMEFYKEKGIKPFGTIGTLIVQVPIFIGLYRAVYLLIQDQNTLQTFAYDWVKNLPHIKHLAEVPSDFSYHFLGFADLSLKGLKAGGGIYFAAIVLALLAAYFQYRQSKSMMGDQKDARKLRDILKAASEGEQADQTEMSMAVSRGMIFLMPFMTFIFSISIPSALSLYLLTSSLVGWAQQVKVFKIDEEEMHDISSIPEAKVVTKKSTTDNSSKPKNPKKSSNQKSKKKRRK